LAKRFRVQTSPLARRRLALLDSPAQIPISPRAGRRRRRRRREEVRRHDGTRSGGGGRRSGGAARRGGRPRRRRGRPHRPLPPGTCSASCVCCWCFLVLSGLGIGFLIRERRVPHSAPEYLPHWHCEFLPLNFSSPFPDLCGFVRALCSTRRSWDQGPSRQCNARSSLVSCSVL
jgi:hypothetical protein